MEEGRQLREEALSEVWEDAHFIFFGRRKGL